MAAIRAQIIFQFHRHHLRFQIIGLNAAKGGHWALDAIRLERLACANGESDHG